MVFAACVFVGFVLGYLVREGLARHQANRKARFREMEKSRRADLISGGKTVITTPVVVPTEE